MKKDAYYFPHFSNARLDRKLKRVIKDLGVEGYGIYFMILEILREQPEFRYPMTDVDLLADEFKVSQAKVEAVIKGYELFELDSLNFFFSSKFIFYLQPYLEKTKRAQLAASKRWEEFRLNKCNANALPEHSNSTANAMQGKERKGKERKEKESKEKENKNSFYENVLLTTQEYNTLVLKYSEPRTLRMIEKLSITKSASGKTYKSDYSAILNWVVDWLIEQEAREAKRSGHSEKFGFNQVNENSVIAKVLESK